MHFVVNYCTSLFCILYGYNFSQKINLGKLSLKKKGSQPLKFLSIAASSRQCSFPSMLWFPVSFWLFAPISNTNADQSGSQADTNSLSASADNILVFQKYFKISPKASSETGTGSNNDSDLFGKAGNRKHMTALKNTTLLSLEQRKISLTFI